jgi:hypothetical protein
MTITTVSTQDTFYAAVKAAKPGDTILIANGSYPAWIGPPANIAEPGVQIKPVDGASVTLEGLDVSGSSGLKVSSLEISPKVQTWKAAVYCTNASRNTFTKMLIHSADGTRNGGGFSFRNSQDCSFTNSELHDLAVGGSLLQCDRILVQGNKFYNISVDGIDVGTSNNCKIYQNDFTDFFVETGTHPDAIQFWDTLNLGATGNEARDNTIRGGASTPMPPQGIFVESQQNLTITGNAMIDTLSNGISVSSTNVAEVDDNYVQNAAVLCRGGSTKTVFKDNYCRINSPGTYAGPGEPVVLPADFLVSGTVLIPDVVKGDLTGYNAWIAKMQAAGGTIPGATPPPVITPPPPPVTDPLQSQLDAANATISQLQSKTASLQNQLTTTQTQLAALQTHFNVDEDMLNKIRTALG